MALIEIYHVVADFFDVNPLADWTATEGQWGSLVEQGGKTYVEPAGATSNVMGCLGDSRLTNTAGTPYAADLIIGAHQPNPTTGKSRSTQNRVSDSFDETLASGKMTVYHGGGKFATDQFETLTGGNPIDYNPGQALYVSANANLTNVGTSGTNPRVGFLVEGPKDFPSGVPGTDTPDGSLSLGSYVTFVMDIQNPD